MKKEGLGLFANFFSAKGNSENPQTSRDVEATSAAQPHVLREKMKEQQLTHGETVKANLSPVRLEFALGNAYVYFCPMKKVEILETITSGDGGDIPANVIVEGLTVPTEQTSGLYTLKNVKLSSNGTMQVIATENTTWEEYHEPASTL
ncbi:MAG TPA: hypothetical protein VEB86_17960 [Chryseosolibacter sp.]|nr:hypothetical protein [Chryseosolibacter sp.]